MHRHSSSNADLPPPLLPPSPPRRRSPRHTPLSLNVGRCCRPFGMKTMLPAPLTHTANFVPHEHSRGNAALSQVLQQQHTQLPQLLLRAQPHDRPGGRLDTHTHTHQRGINRIQRFRASSPLRGGLLVQLEARTCRSEEGGFESRPVQTIFIF